MRPELLTSPQIPKPLHGVNPRSIFGRSWWDEKRKKAYNTFNNHCWACGTHKDESLYRQYLEAHEDYDINWKTGKVKLKEIVALCHSCHNFIHSGRLLAIYRAGEVAKDYVECILRHGFSICRWGEVTPFIGAYVTEGIIKGMSTDEAWAYGRNKGGWEPPEYIASWENWHLVLENEKYYSKFKDINEWQEYHGVK